MGRDELRGLYFEWMHRLVCPKRHPKMRSYRKLLRHLHDTNFFYIVAMDSNREADGIDLRYRFAYENTYDAHMAALCLDDRPCSVLEMLVALAIRCEEHIMDDPDIGNRTAQWFWGMIENLALTSMSDARFDAAYVDEALSRFLDRRYSRNGEGGLFTIEDCKYDLRQVEIWYQMCWYLDTVVSREGHA